MPACGVACVIVLLAIRTHTYARVWSSNLTLWRQAAIEAPLKPRPWLNYGEAVVRFGGYDEARRAWTRAEQVANLPSVRPWDRVVAHRLAGQNLHTLAAIEGR